MIALQDPTAARAVAASELFGQNAQVLLSNSPVVAQTITRMLSTSPDSPITNAQVVGNPEAEKGVFKFLTQSLNSINEGRYNDNDKAKKEAETLVHIVTGKQYTKALERSILKELGKLPPYLRKKVCPE